MKRLSFLFLALGTGTTSIVAGPACNRMCPQPECPSYASIERNAQATKVELDGAAFEGCLGGACETTTLRIKSGDTSTYTGDVVFDNGERATATADVKATGEVVITVEFFFSGDEEPEKDLGVTVTSVDGSRVLTQVAGTAAYEASDYGCDNTCYQATL